MTDTLFDQHDNLTVRLPWHTICALACRALIDQRSIDELVTSALEDYLAVELARAHR